MLKKLVLCLPVAALLLGCDTKEKDRSDFRNLSDTRKTAMIKKPMVTPTNRLMYSIFVFRGLKSLS